ncbi:MAG: hypothetical protein J6V10_07425 [Clostridia bacterium]|nr:hypothetical protein [Clostridia bacterium]
MIEKLSVGGVLGEAWRIYRLHFFKILLLTLLIILPVSVLNGLITDAMTNDSAVKVLFDMLNSGSQSTATAEEVSEAMANAAPRMIPFLLVLAVLLVLADVFTIAVARIGHDEGRHGALSLNYKIGDLTVVNEHEPELVDVGTATEYFTGAIRMLPAWVLTVLAGSVFVFFGFMFMFMPGLIALALLSITVYTVAAEDRKGFKALGKTLRVIIAHPVVVLYFIATFGLTFALANLMSLAISGILAVAGLGESTVAAVAASAVGTTLIYIPAAFGDLVMAVVMTNRLDIINFRDRGSNPGSDDGGAEYY